MRKTIVILAVLFLCAGGIAVAAWRVADSGGSEPAEPPVAEGTSFQAELEDTLQTENPGDSGQDTAQEAGETAYDYEGEGDGSQSGEDFSYTNPDQRYVTETQRHQNFFKAVAEGKVHRLQVTKVDYRPVSDPDTSYVYFTITTDSGTSNGTFVMKFEGGMWRIAAINQLQGDLEGGTNYKVPESFEGDLAREISELQPFLTKVAEGAFSYMTVDSFSQPGENESVLTGVVVGKSGKTVPAEMRLRRDYGIWHLTYITNPP